MQQYDIQIITIPSVLGLQSTGVTLLAESLLQCGLAEKLSTAYDVIAIPTLNHLQSGKRDPSTLCLNATAIREFSLSFMPAVHDVADKGRFALALGGDCSILLGIMPTLKQRGEHGLLFIDAHADFYEPEKSSTGEVADMDLALVTGRGPKLLTNINNLCPYVTDENVIHIGQRDWEETKQFGSQDIKETAISCFDLEMIRQKGMKAVNEKILEKIESMAAKSFWINFDTDVLDDKLNPTVDYRLPGGLSFEEARQLLRTVLSTGKAIGMSITIFNPEKDSDGSIAHQITYCVAGSFNP